MFVFKAAVVGAGTMGGEIAQTIADAGIPVVLKDVRPELVERGLEKARSLWEARLEQGKLDAAGLREKLELITATTEYRGFGEVDLVIEAVPERLEVKQAVFAELDAVTPGRAILASNTSALSITQLGEATSRPDQVVGFHFFYPASVMRLVEVIEGEDTSAETALAAATFAQRIRKLPIRCAEAPGFVVNRILNSSVSELWRLQEETGIEARELDRLVTEAKAAPMGPFLLADLLGLDTVLHVAEHLREAYGERFYVHQGMRALVDAGELGAKTGKGFYGHGPGGDGGDGDGGDGDGGDGGGGDGGGSGGGSGSASGVDGTGARELVERFALKALVESCLVLEEGISSMREIDLGLTAGAGITPPPFARADQQGLDQTLERLERAAEEWGEAFEAPVTLRRLVAQGRLGVKAGQGFYPHPRPDSGFEDGPVKLESRGRLAIAWLDRPPANSISPDMVQALRSAWDRVGRTPQVRAVVFASANPQLFCAGADIKAFTTMDAAAGQALLDQMHELLRSLEGSSIATIAAVNAAALGGGNELAMACDIRIAAQSASFGQPEINLGIIPGFGGTQRLARLLGDARALEMNLTGDPIDAAAALELGLVNRVVADQDLFDTALAWARKLAEQPPLAIERLKRVSAGAALDAGLEAEKRAFLEVFGSGDAREGIAAFLAKRAPRFTGS
jgi:enoyl-CoA hydratase/3-hydroxyacyl-CoA dehydrogenase